VEPAHSTRLLTEDMVARAPGRARTSRWALPPLLDPPRASPKPPAFGHVQGNRTIDIGAPRLLRSGPAAALPRTSDAGQKWRIPMKRSRPAPRPLTALALVVIGLAVAGPGWGYDGPVEKKTFTLPSYTTVGGQTIKNVRVGYESYGTLNAARDNVVLIAHFFTGNSHAAGKYQASDAAPGYWDAIIGAGKPIDTDRFFVISSDTLVNLNTKDPNTVTTGPASIDPAAGRPSGMTFPIVTIRDFVNVQKALLDSLGIVKLRAVAGASMGALQSFEWAAAYPDVVERIIPVIPAAEANA